ncbi:MAG: carbon starvation protein A [Bacteroides sp.]|nr:carbon starvation protein A [Bacteroides sp.]
MITFTICLLILIAGYFVYGKFVERIMRPDNRKTPAVVHPDGVDYIPMPAWKLYMIQFLNIAGLGPIFGAIMGAQFGTASFIWIVVGTIFAGATHDYMAGMLSLRNDGESLPETVGRYLGLPAKQVMRVFTVLLLILVGAVFVSAPTGLLAGMTHENLNITFWIVVIFLYYILATLLPIDKIIGKVYPLFAIAIIFMGLGILAMLFWHWPKELPEFTESFGTNYTGFDIFPMMFVSIACGAISGFHATQSPLIARCMTHEKQGRPIFYGAMITEGIVALIWAAAATYFYGNHQGVLDAEGIPFTGASVATAISKDWLGQLGGLLALVGIIAAPISTGDTALRSARLMVADFFKVEQKTIPKRLLISIPIFLVTMGFLLYSIKDAAGFNIIWRYFAWSNQALSVFTLWTLTVYLTQNKKPYLVTLIPALFMTSVCVTYICYAPEGIGLSQNLSYLIGTMAVLISIVWYIIWRRKFVSKLRY